MGLNVRYLVTLIFIMYISVSSSLHMCFLYIYFFYRQRVGDNSDKRPGPLETGDFGEIGDCGEICNFGKNRRKCMKWRKWRNWRKISSLWRFELDAKSGNFGENGYFGKYLAINFLAPWRLAILAKMIQNWMPKVSPLK